MQEEQIQFTQCPSHNGAASETSSPQIPTCSSLLTSSPSDNCVLLVSSLSILLALTLLPVNSHRGDLWWFARWAKEMAGRGFSNPSSNYPPVFMNYLYMVSWFYNRLSLPFTGSVLMKLMVLPLLMVSHVGVIYILRKIEISTKTKDGCSIPLILYALNPAILHVTAMWGQIDILPFFPVLAALYLLTFTQTLAPFALVFLL